MHNFRPMHNELSMSNVFHTYIVIVIFFFQLLQSLLLIIVIFTISFSYNNGKYVSHIARLHETGYRPTNRSISEKKNWRTGRFAHGKYKGATRKFAGLIFFLNSLNIFISYIFFPQILLQYLIM